MTQRNTLFACAAALVALGLAGPALAWTATDTSDGVIITHRSNGLTVEMGCARTQPGQLGVRITGLNANNITTLTARITQPGGRSNDAAVPALGSATTVEGQLDRPTRFLDAFASGIGFQLLADGTLVMDTHLDGTAVARGRLSAVCGF